MILIVSLVACSNSNTGNSSATPAGDNDGASGQSEIAGETPSETPDTAQNESTGNTGEKTLVVVYSASGNTKRIADIIVSTTGDDLFEITPKEPYTSDDLDWTDRDSRVSREHEDESLRNVELTTTAVENWDEYDTVFIGYPIWWGIAAWPTDTFVKANDFTGKTVIPFCTSSSSGLGQSGELLKDEATGGNWLEGQRFQSRASEDTVKEWVRDLEL